MARQNQSPAQKVREQAKGSAKRTRNTDKRLLGPAPIEVDGVTVGSVEVVERARKRGEPSVLLIERDANGAPTAPSLLGAIALHEAGFLA